ncbi:sn1-specific diacylglycerol lipase beta isoform X1 [Senna tora]|uniref:Sn1-specific diacylglycerol lipase beta isoform X1 n=1 Tax=Senna tora TaxID=362788 RepID=A0A835CBD0_9FABA|nr:sn1-specific diacylglycerol lipase beta isoform X1 [Senna tora]
MWVSRLSKLRFVTILIAISNFFVVILGAFLILQAFPVCDHQYVLPFVLVSVAALLRIGVMVQTGIAQQATANCILQSPSNGDIVVDSVMRVQRRCFSGSDVLRWRSFYETHDNAWKYHYREVFDNGIRETLCCLGRVKYMYTPLRSAMEEDEVYSVAQLLGDLVAYRASGTGHLELLAGLVLLQKRDKSSESFGECLEAPEMQIREAATLHKFAEAAYTGPLLDVGRNPFIFPCAWLYRQGVLCPWTRNRRPVLVGDNWWRGHAAAFLKYVNLPPEVLRHGRVNQVKCEAAYFVVVLHHARCVLITIRGTETPEDLITDGLCKECTLSAEDLAGLTNCNHIHSDVKRSVTSSFPHYGHSGIVEAAREIFMQIEGNPGEHESNSNGILSTLLGAGCECDGYNVRIVGHSLGGAIAALLGIRLYQRYPNLHVYSYGPLPCVDSVVANACSEFVTSVVFGNEFSSCLSIGSVLRLREAAVTFLSEYPKADSAKIFQFAYQFLNKNKCQISNATMAQDAIAGEDLNHQICRSRSETSTKGNGKQDIQEFPVWTEANKTNRVNNGDYEFTNSFTGEAGRSELEEYSLWVGDGKSDQVDKIHDAELRNPFAADVSSSNDPASQLIDIVRASEDGRGGRPPEMYLPGLVVHIVPEPKSSPTTTHWTPWRFQEKENHFKAYIADRESFKDIVVSPSMFLDHLPWRCHHALQKLTEARNAQGQFVGAVLVVNMAYEISEIKSVALLLGWRSLWNLFTSRANYKGLFPGISCPQKAIVPVKLKLFHMFLGSASFILGLFFIFVRWPVVGIVLEIFGCFVLFSSLIVLSERARMLSSCYLVISCDYLGYISNL